MRKSWSMCVLLGALAWGQAPPGTPPPQSGTSGPPNAAAPQAPATPGDTSAAVAPDAPVLTIKGVCPSAPRSAMAKTPAGKSDAPAVKAPADSASKTASADCKTVITKAEFEKMANGLAPNVTPQLKHQLATVLPRLMAMSQAAEKKGLDKNPRYKEMMKFARMQILTNELQRDIQEQASKVPQQEIADYYKKNPEAYEQYNLDRLFVPRTKQPGGDEKETDNDKDEKLTPEQQKAKEADEKTKQEQGEQEMTKLAESLQARAAAGEDFTKLQKEAFEAAGMKIDSPSVNLPKVRRTGLPPAHASVFDLKAGQVSPVINDTGGHYVYKVIGREQLPLDQVKDEIRSSLQNQRTRDAMEKYQNSFHVETNEAYFGPAGGVRGAMPPARGGQRPNAATPGAQPTPQGAPPAQPPDEKPD